MIDEFTARAIGTQAAAGWLDTLAEVDAALPVVHGWVDAASAMLQALVGLLGPLLIVVMGVFVLAIVFAMLMPIFEMNTLVR